MTATSALLWLFAGAAVLVLLGFGLAAFLSYRHARTRRARAELLRAYLAGVDAPGRTRAELRESVMHISIGDLVRDSVVAEAAAAR